MRVIIEESAYRDLRRIDTHTVKTILLKLKELENYPMTPNVKKLKKHYPPMRYRIGSYRVLFEIVEDTLRVINIKHRKEAYK